MKTRLILALTLLFTVPIHTEEPEYVSDGELISWGIEYTLNHLLTLKDHEIKEVIAEVQTIAERNNLNTRFILETISLNLTEWRDYHKEHIKETKDHYAKKFAIVASSIAGATFITTYILYRTLVKPVSHERDEILNSPITTTVHETESGVEIYHSSRFLNNPRLDELTIDYIQYSVLTGVVGTCGFFPLLIGFNEFYKYLFVDPLHKERYERLVTVLAYLDEAIQAEI